ncbi:SMP-30/gluconolactonase/LRE family protein [Kineosporia sp. A_224]|uniref:SMP-30/gluconolactonase/LRE family protein n=1 Tax=Kineosporia sp. A_224 TaxID=1962180 RepID=UPI001E5818AA|nr:SMP-30/gluconolactonase/LRE family protein [Kineosporia sp. A_224]
MPTPTVPTVLDAEQVTDVCTHHGEGPVWDAAAGVLRFVDLVAGGLMTFDPATGAVRRRTLGPVVACLRPRRDGGLVVALERTVVLLDDPDDEAVAPRTVATLPLAAGARCNDGGCDSGGDLLLGTMAYDESPGAGSLYRVAPTGAARAVVTGATISNGFCFDPTGTFAYWTDTPTGRVERLRFAADGSVAAREPFVTVDPAAGHPDGLTVDAAGGVWVALWAGSAVHRYAPDGTLDVVVRVPARQVSCPAFGGPGLGDLYVTTSRQGLAAGEDPQAGALFRVTPGVRGLPVVPFAG